MRLILLGSMAFLAAARGGVTQEPSAAVRVQVTLHGPAARRPVPTVVWLSAEPGTPQTPFTPHGVYTLLQKNRMFHPHVQVVPVGAVVQFPNADPYFHNVFSLFDGKRFDLGLYEAGSSKAVTFPREGVSYIFCNIHPEMSAVILTLSTPFYATGMTGSSLSMRGIPAGDYELKVWVEGVQSEVLDRIRRRVHLTADTIDQEQIAIDVNAISSSHKDKFGKDYPSGSNAPY